MYMNNEKDNPHIDIVADFCRYKSPGDFRGATAFY